MFDLRDCMNAVAPKIHKAIDDEGMDAVGKHLASSLVEALKMMGKENRQIILASIFSNFNIDGDEI